MSLSRRQLRTLRGIECELAWSDPGLNEFFLYLAEVSRGCEMPRVERVARWPSRMLARLRRCPAHPGRMRRVAAGGGIVE